MRPRGTARAWLRKEELEGLLYEDENINGELPRIHRPRRAKAEIDDLHETGFGLSAESGSSTSEAPRLNHRAADLADQVFEALRVLCFRHGCRLTPQFSGRALPYQARRERGMQWRARAVAAPTCHGPLQLRVRHRRARGN